MDDRWRKRLTMVRSALTGALATLVDLALLALLVGVLGVPARIANAPALLAGATVQFFGNRHFAFRARQAPVGRQLLWFTLSEVVTLGLNALLFDLAMRAVPSTALVAMLVRTAASFAVFTLWSYPVWQRIFVTSEGAGALGADPSRRGA